jgi:DnaJ-class molecular chaperone
LGLKEGASKEEVKKSFFKIAQENHPDKNDTAKAKSIFMKAKDSYEKLKDVDP